MPTYFLNSAGSNTAPYDTDAKGATTLKTLLDNITQQSGDIINVTDDGVIDDTGAVIPNITVPLTIQSDPGNSGVPEMSAQNSTHNLAFTTGAHSPVVKGIKFSKPGTASDRWIVYNPTSQTALTVEDCEFVGANPTTNANANAIEVANPGDFSGACNIKRNKFTNCRNHFIVAGAPE